MQAPIELGTVIQNRYRILSILGQGGFGRTYLAEDQSRFKEPCAIKELIPPAAGDYALQKSKELFQREGQVLYQIQHPQVPQFHATFEQDGRFFIVQDYINGKTYREQLEQLRSQGYVFSEAEVQQLINQLLPTLTYLHGKGIIHRDISPENIILRETDRQPVLIDFGVVKELATKIQTPGNSVQATTVGKVGFAPSEQMQTGRAFPNSDLYALAVTAIVLLTGREPQELLDDRAMKWKWQRWASVNPDFAAILNRMLSFAPGDRYASATEVQRMMQSIGQGGSAPMAPPTTPPPELAAPPPTQEAAPPTPPAPSVEPTVAIGRGITRPQPYRNEPDAALQRNEPDIPRQSSLWDDPFAILSVGIGLMFIAAIGTWAAFNRFNQGPKPTPTPISRSTASPTPTSTTKPQPKPAVFSQPL
ncbi:serine/threonine protein kinase, partial [filamentous cyanobacterium LEGE 11480]